MIDAQEAIDRPSTVHPLGRYLVLARLGRGGMADVYLALVRGPSGFNKLVVLKLLREHLEEDGEFLRMFLAEARLAARLNHPNIVQTYEVGVEDERHCIVMEYLEGRSLAFLQSSEAGEGLSLNLSLRVLADTLAGLHSAHECCDLNGRPEIGDFRHGGDRPVPFPVVVTPALFQLRVWAGQRQRGGGFR